MPKVTQLLSDRTSCGTRPSGPRIYMLGQCLFLFWLFRVQSCARSRCWFPQPFLWFMSKEKFLPRHVRLSISILVPSISLSLFIYIYLFLHLKLVGVEFLLPQLPENHCQNVLKYVYHLEEIPSADSRLHCLPLDPPSPPVPLPPAPFPPTITLLHQSVFENYHLNVSLILT